MTEEKEGGFANKPVWEMRSGTSKASSWANQSEKGTFHTVRLEHSYKDADGTYKPSNSFTPPELAVYNKLADMAFAKSVELDTGRGRSR